MSDVAMLGVLVERVTELAVTEVRTVFYDVSGTSVSVAV